MFYILQENDCSGWYKSLSLQFYLDGALMTVECIEDAAPGESGDMIPAGSYAMRPVGVTAHVSTKESRLCPADDGPYQPEELGMQAVADWPFLR